MSKGEQINVVQVINGSFGELLDADGNFLGNAQGVEFRITNKKRAFTPIGFSREANKHVGTSGDGIIEQFKMTTRFLQTISGPMMSAVTRVPVTRLVVALDDPEALGAEEIVLIGVKLWDINGGWRVNEIVKESISFTFQTIHIPHAIIDNSSSMFEDNLHSKYSIQRNL
jgi:hypothetical protein